MDPEYARRMFDISGQVVVITGGGGVLCGTFARGLAKAGARIAVLDILPEAAQKVAQDIAAAGGEAVAIQADVLSRESLVKAAEQVLARYGAVNALINGAGGNRKQATTAPGLSFFDLPEDACESFRALYEGLQEMERDLHQHIHLENNVLFPKARELRQA